MIGVIKNRLSKIFTLKVFYTLMIIAMIFLLAGCERQTDTSIGKDGNISAQASCWQTAIINAVASSLDSLYSGAKNTLQSSNTAIPILAIAFAIWLAFKLLKVLGSFKEENLGEVWSEIFQKLFLCSVCAYIVSDGSLVDAALNIFLMPIYKTILELTLEALNIGGGNSIDLGIFGRITFNLNSDTCSSAAINNVSVGASGAISSLSNCVICKINNRLNSGIYIGINLIVSMRLGAILVGLAVLVMFTFAKFMFVFCVIDSLFRLNFATYLLPIFIMGIPFNFTRKWSKHCFEMFLNSAGILLFIGLLVALSIGSLEQAFNDYNDFLRDDDAFSIFEGLGIPLLCIVLLTLLFVNLPEMGIALADKLIGGGGGLAFQKKVKAFVEKIMKKVASSAINSLTNGSTTPLTNVADKYEKLRETQDAIKKLKEGGSNSLSNIAGYNDD